MPRPFCANCKAILKKSVINWIAHKKTFSLLGCSQCDLIQLFPKPTEVTENLYENVSTDAYAKAVNPQLKFIYTFALGKKILNWYHYGCYKSRVETVLKYKRSGSILDIGCADGQFLELFDKNWQKSGVELNHDFVMRARKRLPRAYIHESKFEDFKKISQKYDVITLWHVFEHLENPYQILRKAHQLIKPDGLVVIEVPHGNSLIFGLFGKHWQLIMFPQHLFFWTEKSMRYMAPKTGFGIVDIESVGFISSGPASFANYLRSLGIASPVASTLGLSSLPFWICIALFSPQTRDNLLIVMRKN